MREKINANLLVNKDNSLEKGYVLQMAVLRSYRDTDTSRHESESRMTSQTLVNSSSG